jgi:aminoglycoside 3'-phosphotransferase-1
MPRDSRETPVPPVQLPADLAVLVHGYQWSQNTVGESGDAVYRLQKTDIAQNLFLKHAPASSALDVAGEMVRLQWLIDHIAVPEVQAFSGTKEECWLLMTGLPGKTAYQLLEAGADDQRVSIVDRLALLLRRLHAIPVEGCPFNSDHRLRLGEARWRIDHGLVNISDVDEGRHGCTAEEVWTELTDLLPFAPDPVVTHGDFSLDNIILTDGDGAGCIDVGRAGIADRYQDLAILSNCLGEFGASLQQRFFESYGIADPDIRKIRFHLLLDDLF